MDSFRNLPKPHAVRLLKAFKYVYAIKTKNTIAANLVEFNLNIFTYKVLFYYKHAHRKASIFYTKF